MASKLPRNKFLKKIEKKETKEFKQNDNQV